MKLLSVITILTFIPSVVMSSSQKSSLENYIALNKTKIKYSKRSQIIRPSINESSWKIGNGGKHLNNQISANIEEDYYLNRDLNGTSLISSRSLQDGQEFEQNHEVITFSDSGNFQGKTTCRHDFRNSLSNFNGHRKYHCVTVTPLVCQAISKLKERNNIDVEELKKCSETFVRSNNFIEKLKTDNSFLKINESHVAQVEKVSLSKKPDEYFRNENLASDGKIHNVLTFGKMNTSADDKVRASLSYRPNESYGTVHLSKMMELCGGLRLEGVDYQKSLRKSEKDIVLEYSAVLIK